MSGAKLVQGNEACVRGALAAGCNFYAGYPITPSSEIAEIMVRRLPDAGGVFIQMEDEIASLATVIGASLAGSKAMTATSGPGFSLMQEHIGFATMAEVPCVIVDVMRGGPSTGLPTSPSQGDIMQARWGTHGDHPAIVLAPSSVGEVFDLTVKAFNLAERFRTPVILIYDEIIGHTRESVVLPDRVDIVDRSRPNGNPSTYQPKAPAANGVPPMVAFGDGYRFHVTGLTHNEHGFPTTDPGDTEALITRIHDKVYDHQDEISAVEEFMLDDAEVAIFAYGIVGRSAREAVLRARRAGMKVGLIRPLTLWPFPYAQVADVAAGIDTLLVAEMNLGQLIGEVERAVAGTTEVIGHLRADGEPITPADLIAALPDPAGART
ncbi:MAG: 2-oxoacid:acceptor oxidoreductase subunit alpha [Actinobacteria bacterium]|jgi:2-oxoglutarate ferredoxin oxidoreductase subunit alpha|nr:2-oxoacid:acceptor oxidoreductase subunit alpha [Actinomycetota bacterium]MBT3688000.1 2-oxoacid:acceptor oxidoreductase subunit alpha [Actinomycetota bacterium]MBT4036837.1 2-oxoacid:acceptor oxidoreductase subunit alpha [Actinomycetota bacterium]MBT4278533.1 2-oxoacid:acceptor oxidoreductase subunit alpha [Actinomycetota bacterium]MBT4343764.1 2-oxoacid:acceptor oxidoreductase subunit alpha [Actinomycetota bacterium]